MLTLPGWCSPLTLLKPSSHNSIYNIYAFTPAATQSTSGAAAVPDQSAVTANATLAAAPAATPAAAPGTPGIAAPDQSPPTPMPPPPGQPPVGLIPSPAVNARGPADPAAIIEVPNMAMVKRDGWTSRLGNATAGCFAKRR